MIIKAFDIEKNFTKRHCYEFITKFFVNHNITTSNYLQAMEVREKQASFYIGNFVAIPHGASNFSKEIKSTGIVIFRFRNAINWEGNKVHYVIGIAAIGNEQIEILQKIAISFCTESEVLKSLQIPINNLVSQLKWK